MRKILLFLAFALLSSPARALNAPKVIPLGVAPSLSMTTNSVNSIKSYREWKNEKVQAVLSQVLLTRNQVLRAKAEGQALVADTLGKQLSQQQWNLEVANDLSVADYFVLYLSQQSQVDRFQQAAHRLTTNEVAELMQAYAMALGSVNPESLAQGPSGVINLGRKIPSQATQNSDQIK